VEVHDLGFDQFTKRAELELKFIEVIAEARLKDAKSRSADAKVVEQQLTNYCKAKSIQEYERSLRSFHNAKVLKEKEIQRLSDKLKSLSFYKLGHRIPDFQRQPCWEAYLVLLRFLPFQESLNWSKTPMPETTDADWIGRTISGRSIPAILPEGLRSVSDLLDFQYGNRTSVMVRFGSPCHIASMEALASLELSAIADVKKLEEAIEAVRKGTYDIWQPQELIKITDSPVS